MNALFVLRPAKLWAFNFGHPCPPSKKGEVLLLGQAEPTMVGIVNALEAFMVSLLSISILSPRTTPPKPLTPQFLIIPHPTFISSLYTLDNFRR